MEGSDITQSDAPAEGESADGTEVVVGKTGSEWVAEHKQEHEPLKESDNHGSVTPASAPPPQAQSGDPLDPLTKRAIDPDRPNPAQGERTPPGAVA